MSHIFFSQKVGQKKIDAIGGCRSHRLVTISSFFRDVLERAEKAAKLF
jgi:hypothetical protein